MIAALGRARRRLAGALLAAGLATPALAQVNAETLRAQPWQPGWSGNADLSLTAMGGNVSLLDLGLGGRLQWQTLYSRTEATLPPHVAQRWLLSGNGRLALKSGSAFVNQGFLHTRWTGMWLPWLGCDVFAQHQFNRFQRLLGRSVGGVGGRLELVHLQALQLAAGSGYMLEYNLIDPLPGASDPPQTLEHRWTNYLTARLSLWEDGLLVQDTVYLQPRLDAFGDLRMLNETELLVKVTERIGLSTTLSVWLDTQPPAGVQPWDVRLLSSLRVGF